MSATRPRVWLYLRVSHDPTGRGLSVSSQEDELRAWAERENWTIAGVTTDNDMSASRNKKTRPGYREVQRSMAAGAMDILACWESSRAQRDLEAYVQTRNLCEQHNVLFAYKGRVYDLSHTNDRFTTGLDALLDERYSDETRDRVIRGVTTSLKRGTARGKIPFGYRRTYDPGTGAMETQVPDPETAPIVRELFERVAAGDPIHAIAQDFNRRGVPTPQEHRDARRGVTAERGGWTGSKIRRQLGNPNVAGYRIHQGRIQGEAGWEPLVGADVFAVVTRRLADPNRRTQNGVEAKWLLSGILLCGVCGAKCRRIADRGRPSYACHGKNFTNDSCVCMRQVAVDGYVVERLLLKLGEPDAITSLTNNRSAELAEAAQELADLEARLETFMQSALEPKGISADMLARVRAKYEPLIAEARLRATPTWVPRAAIELTMGDVDQRWAELDLTTRRTVIAALMRVTLHKDTRPRGSHGHDLSRIQIEWRTQV
jgi:site-specific DNA recombinase